MIATIRGTLGLINVWPVVDNHYKNIIEDSPAAWLDMLLLLGVPLVTSLAAYEFQASAKFVKVTISTLTILFGFTFNAVVLLAARDDTDKKRTVRYAISMTKGNAVYALLVAFLTLICSFIVFLITLAPNFVPAIVITLASGVLYFMLSHYIITLLVVLRRLYILIEGNVIDSPK